MALADARHEGLSIQRLFVFVLKTNSRTPESVSKKQRNFQLSPKIFQLDKKTIWG